MRLLIFLILPLCSTSQSDSSIYCIISNSTAIYPQSEISENKFFLDKSQISPAVSYKKSKLSIHEFIEVYIKGGMYFVLLGQSGLTNSEIEVLKKRDRSDYVQRKFPLVKDLMDSLNHKDSVNSIRQLTEQRKEEVADSLYRSRVYDAGIKSGLLIYSYSFEEGYVFTSFYVSIKNLSKKSIKYIWFTVSAYNAVDDIIQTKTVQGIGPIPYFDNASYDFKSAFSSTVVSKVVVKSIKIQYLDLTTKVLTNEIIRHIILPSD